MVFSPMGVLLFTTEGVLSRFLIRHSGRPFTIKKCGSVADTSKCDLLDKNENHIVYSSILNGMIFGKEDCDDAHEPYEAH
jgi:hypothetical protein